MSFTDFYMNQNAGASDLNSGSTCSDVGGGSDSAIYTSTGGNFDGTSVFTPTDSSTPANTISVGMYVSLYNTGDTVCRAVAQVTAVGAGVNGTVTVSTTIKYGTFPTSNSGSRALKCGGAWTSLNITKPNGPIYASATTPQSTRINIKAATYANTTLTLTLGMSGTAVLLFWLRGYKTTPGDQDANNSAIAGTDIPLITFTTGYFGTLNDVTMSSIAFSGASTTSSRGVLSIGISSTGFTGYGLQVTNTAANANGYAVYMLGNYSRFIGCIFTATGTATACVSYSTYGETAFIGCQVIGGITGLLGTTGNALVNFCSFYNQQGDCISGTTGFPRVINSSFYSPLGNGINITGTLVGIFYVVNCYFSNVNQAGKAAIANTSGTNTTSIQAIANAYYNCTANTSGITENFTIFDNGTLASEAFVAPAASPPNFAVNPVAWNLGFPGKFPGTSTYQGYLAVGAVQPLPGYVLNRITNQYLYSEPEP